MWLLNNVIIDATVFDFNFNSTKHLNNFKVHFLQRSSLRYDSRTKKHNFTRNYINI